MPAPGTGTFPVVGAKVAISDDGNVVAFTYGQGSRPTTRRRRTSTCGIAAPPASRAQLISRTAAGGPSGGNSYDPSISGDGNLVSFYSFATDLAVGPQPANQSFVAVFDRSTTTMRLVANDASEPDISRDGRHIAYNLDVGEIGDVYAATSTSAQPFATIATDLVSYSLAGPPTTTFGSASGPAISEHGRWVAFHSYAGDLLTSDARFADGWHVYARQRRPVLAVSPIDFGTVQVGNTFDLTSTVSNQGPSGFVVTSIAASGGFSVVNENCPDVLHRGQSCAVTVRFGPTAATQSTGQLTVRDDTYTPVPLAYSGALRGTGSAVAVTTTLPPVVNTTTTAPSVPTSFALAIEPAALAFPGGTVGIASATQMAQVRNTGTGSNTVSGVSLGGTNAADFAVVSTNCAGAALAPGATCDVEVGFTPTDAGARVCSTHRHRAGRFVGVGGVDRGRAVRPDVGGVSTGRRSRAGDDHDRRGIPALDRDPARVGRGFAGVRGHERRDGVVQAPRADPRAHVARTTSRVSSCPTRCLRAGRHRSRSSSPAPSVRRRRVGLVQLVTNHVSRG